MRIIIDTNKKTVQVLEPVSIIVLVDWIKDKYPDEWEEWDVVAMIKEENSTGSTFSWLAPQINH